MTEVTPTEKPLAGYIDDLDERLLRVEDRMTDTEIALNNETSQRRQMRDELMDRIGQRKGETHYLTERVNCERDVLNVTIGVVLLHLVWHAVAKAVDSWRYR